jgi:FdhD protein
VPEFADRAVLRVTGDRMAEESDVLAAEEPLEIRWAGDPLAVTMRSPGRDHDLVLGFLLSEGIIASAADVGDRGPLWARRRGRVRQRHRRHARPGVVVDIEARFTKRGTVMSAACGVCGRATIEDLLARVSPIETSLTVDVATLRAAVDALEASQRAFARTGGLHGAAAFAADGDLLASAEDIGRHNAVDKVCGALLRECKRADMLVVSSRLGFEIAQKAAVSRIPFVVSVSAASTLAADLGNRLGLTMVGFVRGKPHEHLLPRQPHHRAFARVSGHAAPPFLGIFVGGTSSRMGGAPKGLLQVPGTDAAIVDHLADIGSALGLRVALVGDARAYDGHATEATRLADAPAGVGPLGGLAALLEAAGPSHAVALACDMPAIAQADVATLLALANDPIAWSARRNDTAPWEPFFARYDAPRARPLLLAALAAGERSLQAALARMHPSVAPIRPAALTDWDTPADRLRSQGTVP